jgi:hypothetical protein
MEQDQDLYEIDDILMRAGGLLGVIVMLAAMMFYWAPEPGPPVMKGLVAIAVLAPLGLLGAGFAMRRREKQVVAIRDLLRQQAELHVPPLLANSDFERGDLDRAVRFLNNRGLDHYVWDRGSDTIRDARLQSRHLHVEVCDACGVKIALDVPLAFHKLPTCTHCGDPISAEALLERKREAIDGLRAEYRFEDASDIRPGPSKDFSMLTFVLLLCFFWPGAIYYAWHQWEGEL